MSGALLAERLRINANPGPVPVDAAGHPVCEVSLNWDGTHPRCGEPAIAKTRAMCVHEHYGEGYVCAGCLSDMRKAGDDGGWTCTECARGPESHDCPMPLQVIPLEPEVTP